MNNKPRDYKSLTDVYSSIHKSPVNENVNIVGIPSNGQEQEQLGSVSDDYYQRLKRLVLSKGEGGAESLIKQLLRLSQWEEIEDIDTIVLEIFLNYELNIQVLNKIVEKKKSGNLGTIENFLNKSGVKDLTSCLDPLIKKLTPSWLTLFTELTKKVQPKINTVSVGPGEISLTLFTNATKGSVGDLQVNGMEIEIKGDGGRLGSSDYTKGIFTTPGNKYLNILKDRNQGQHFSQVEQKDTINRLTEKANKVIKSLNGMEGIIKKNYSIYYNNPEENLPGIFAQLYNNLNDITDKSGNISTDIIKSNITTAFDMAKTSEIFPHIKGFKTVAENITYIYQGLDILNKANLDKTDYNWQSSAQYMFNYDWDLTPRELAEAYVEMRTEQLDDGSVKSLITAAEKIFKNADIRKALIDQGGKGRTTGQKTLQRLQAALMATTYQAVHGFPRLVILNTKSLKAAILKFDNNADMGTTLTSIYKQLNNTPEIVVSNPSVDTRNKGIGISVAA